MATRQYFVYMMTNRHRSALYTGVTSALEYLVSQHKTKAVPGFTSRYGVDSLVYFEETSDVHAAITREKQIKGWTRAKKIALIESVNPRWEDLSEAWVHPAPPPDSFAKRGDPATGVVVAQNDTGV